MNELIFSLEKADEKLALTFPKISRPLDIGDFRSFSRGKGGDLITKLLKEHLHIEGISISSSQVERLNFKKLLIRPQRAFEAIKSLSLKQMIEWKGKLLFCDPITELEFSFIAEQVDQSVLVEGRLHTKNAIISFDQCQWVFLGDPSFVIIDQIAYRISDNIDRKWLDLIYPQGSLLEGKQAERFIEQFREDEVWPGAPHVCWQGAVKAEAVEPTPILILEDSNGCLCNLDFDYAGKRVRARDPMGKKEVSRLEESEKVWEGDLTHAGYHYKPMGQSSFYCTRDLVEGALKKLIQRGWMVEHRNGKQIVFLGDKPNLYFSERDCQVEIDIEWNGISLSCLPQEKGELLHSLADGKLALLDGDIREKLILLGQTSKQFKRLSLNYEMLPMISDLFDADRIAFAPSSEDLKQKIALLQGSQCVEVGAGFSGKLLDYQSKGLQWLSFLQAIGGSGLLADEMGLGKTVQVLAFLSRHCFDKPVLIVLPTSLLVNWEREIGRFLPNCTAYRHHGEGRDQGKWEGNQIILTSYGTLRIDREIFTNQEFSVIVFDEAQQIKNKRSQIAQVSFKLKGKMRLALSGTPVENDQSELWTLFHFLLPELLGKERHFLERVKSSPMQIKHAVRPFIMRRLKEQVAIDLPEKIEQEVWIDLDPEQKKLYHSFQEKAKQGLLEKIERDGEVKNRLEVLEMILRLRQICLAPKLVFPDQEPINSKLEMLIEDVMTILSQNRKVIVYSQFAQVLKEIGKRLKKEQISYLYLDGQTKDREKLIDRFQQNHDERLFLISLKTGGIGLNLTAADYVLLYDPWWNEAVEKQAIDRAHRIGRKNTVIARRYLTLGTIEEKIMEMKKKKQKQIDQLFDSKNELENISQDDLLKLLMDS